MNETTFIIIVACYFVLWLALLISVLTRRQAKEDLENYYKDFNDRIECWRNAYAVCVTERNRARRQVQGLRSHVSRLRREKQELKSNLTSNTKIQ